MKYFIGNNLFPYVSREDCTLEQMYEILKDRKIVGLDIETCRKFKRNIYREDVYRPGLDPYMSNICMIQIGDLEDNFIIDARCFDKEILIKYLKPILENEDILKVGHNLKFEGKFFLVHFNIRLVKVWDTMLVEKVLYNGYKHSYSLAALMDRYLGVKSNNSFTLFTRQNSNSNFLLGFNIDRDQMEAEAETMQLEQQFIDKSIRMGFINIGIKPFTEEQIKYGGDDITAPLKIFNKQKRGRPGYLPKMGIRTESAYTQVLAEAEVQGVPFDGLQWLEAYEFNLRVLKGRKKKLDDYVKNNYPQFTSGINLFSNELTCAIQWSSSKQVVNFFKPLDLAVKEKSKSTGKLEWTVGAKSLFRKLPNNLKGNFYKGQDVDIIDTDTLNLQYLLYKKAEQLCTTFGKDWLKYVHPITGKVHTNYNQYMISSRLSSSNPNLQQIPNTTAFRNCFTFDEMINADFSAQELRIAAEVHNVQKMIDFFKKGDDYFGEDLHSFNATQMFKVIHGDKDYVVEPEELPNGDKNPKFNKQHSEERNAAKALGFKLNYGGSAFTISMDLGISIEEGESYVENYFKGLPGMEESFKVRQKLASERGWVILDNYSGKRYFFPDFGKMNAILDEVNKLYPYNYKSLNYEQKKVIKEKLKKETNYSQLWKDYFILKGKLERRALNLPIQGAAATMTKIAGLLLYDYRWSNGLQDVFQVPIYCHDEVLAVITDGNAEKYGKIVADLMGKSGEFILKKVPMKADAVISTVWKH